MNLKDILSIKIGGAAGQGIRTSGLILTNTIKNTGLRTFSYSEYPSLIRGGHTTFQIDFANEEINSVSQKINVLLALDKVTIEKHYSEIKPKGVLLCDDNTQISQEVKDYLKQNKISTLRITIDEIVEAQGGSSVMENSVTLGAIWAVLSSQPELLTQQIKETFSRKAKSIETNLACTKGGYDYVQNLGEDATVVISKQFDDMIKKVSSQADKGKDRIIATGNEIAAIAAYGAGCRVYCAYPMTPSTGILHWLSQNTDRTKMVVKQAEDEITAVQMTLGASFAGTRSACGTSGGGLALMTESLSLSGMTETPLVVFNSQRPGPATGTPTWTEQGDLSFVVNAGHGDFPKIVMAPGDLEDTQEITAKAFNLAEKYQTLVIVLLDKYLSESWFNAEMIENEVEIDRGKILEKIESVTKGSKEANKPFKRYEITSDNISPRPIAGIPGGIHLSNSDEHDEVGYSTENLEMRNRMMEKRMKKLIAIRKDLPKPELIGPKDALKTLVVWGSQKGVTVDAIKIFNKKTETKEKFNILYFSYIYPLKTDRLEELAESNQIITVENNFSGQLAKLIRQESETVIDDEIKKYDGTPFFRDELLELLKEI
jgi:2-oxoglutarate ferredoxin oxidoreductase subunit alpha